MPKLENQPEKPKKGAAAGLVQKARDKATELRRQLILQAAVQCFIDQGYHQTGIRDIARQAGVSLGNLYNHFPGKHDVLVEIARMERVELEPFLKILAGRGAPDRVLDRFIGAYGKYLAQPDNVILSLECAGEAIRQGDIAELFLENRKLLVSALAEILERGADAGSFRSLASPASAAQMIVDLIEGAAYRAVLENIALKKSQAALKDFISGAVRA